MFKILDEVCTPQRGTKYSAYVDLFAREDVIIGAGETKIVPLGVKLDMKMFVYLKVSQLPFEYVINSNLDGVNDFLKSHYLALALRSSLAVKGLIIANGIGIIDLDYPDEIGLIVHYPYNGKGASHYEIKKGDKVAQCTLKEHKGFLLGCETDIERFGGYGSTGV